jgi:hypothetical protein
MPEANWLGLGRQSRLFKTGVVARLCFSWRHVTNRLEETTVVEPVHPFEGGVLDRLQGSPRATAPDDLSLEQADDGLCEGVVVAVADAPDRGLDPGLQEPFGVPDADVLPAPVAMMGQATLRRTTVVQGLFQGVEDKARMSRPRDPPADGEAWPPLVRGHAERGRRRR